MEPKQPKYEKNSKSVQKLVILYPKNLIFWKISIIVFMSFFAFFHMKFPKFKISKKFWSYGAKNR